MVHSPDRSRERACDWIAVGQFWGWAFREWRRWSWILFQGRELWLVDGWFVGDGGLGWYGEMTGVRKEGLTL